MRHMQNAPSYILGIALVVLLLLVAFSSGNEVAMLSATGYKYAEIATIVGLAIFLIVFCELAPKIYAALRPDPVALSSTYIYKVLVFVMTPITWLTNKAAYGFLRLFSVK